MSGSVAKKSRIYERVLRGEMLYLAAPDERCAAYGKPSASYRLTVLPSRSACWLYYRQEGTLYCAAFHPDERQAAVRAGGPARMPRRKPA